MPLTLTRTTDATVEPVSFREACAHLRVDTIDDQDYINALITTARQWVEEATQRQLITATWRLCLDQFPCDSVIILPKPRCISVSSITYYDTNGTLQTWATTEYQVDAYSEPARIRLAPSISWPSTQWEKSNAVTITYTAGYGTAATAVPGPLKQAILILVSQWYENREPVVIGTIVSSIPLSVEALIGPYRVMQTEY